MIDALGLHSAYVKQFCVVFVAGVFGGLAYGLSRYLEEGEQGFLGWARRGKLPKRALARYLAGQSAVGAGGAFAAVFGVLTVGEAIQGGAAQGGTGMEFAGRPLYLAALSVVGGFVANRLLKSVGAALEARLRATEEETAQVKKTSERAEVDANEAKLEAIEGRKMLYDALVARGLFVSLERIKSPYDLEADENKELILRAEYILFKLRNLRNEFPLDRTLFIPLSNLSFELGRATRQIDLQSSALEYLGSFIKSRNDQHIKANDDDVAAWYNIGCFNAILARTTEDAQVVATKKTKAIEALRECLRIAKDLGADALKHRLKWMEVDSDLKDLAKTQEFIDLRGTFLSSQQ